MNLRLNITIIILFLITKTLCSQTKDYSEFENWLKFYDLKAESFDKIGQENKISLNSIKYNKENKNLYKPFFIYSSDSLYYLDLDSYSVELVKDSLGNLTGANDVDINVQLINTYNWTSISLLFCGTPCYAETAVWRNDSIIEIYGFQTNENFIYLPTIWKVNIKNWTISEFQNKVRFNLRLKNFKQNVRLKTVTFK